jgi:RNA polymerase sigma-70 factor (ECF subfamily)
VLAAAGDDSTARRALASLCETYWYPLYAFIRRSGRSADEAPDLTQAFIASLIDRGDFGRLSAERGRFRSFLLASLRHFLANDAARARTLKRGGGTTLLPLPSGEGEGRYLREPAAPATPETLFERQWALTVIEQVLADLRAEASREGRAGEFDRLKACLLGDPPAGGYRSVAESLSTSEGAIKTAVHRLRRRFQRALRRHIAETVLDPADVDDELRFLIRALGT